MQPPLALVLNSVDGLEMRVESPAELGIARLIE
jgi:hypothetical protein